MVDFDSGREERLSANLLTGGVASGGITVRDYFAAKAMAGMIGVLPTTVKDADLANAAYMIADAMMSERDKKAVKQCPVDEAFGLSRTDVNAALKNSDNKL